jgi:hypothetical protein
MTRFAGAAQIFPAIVPCIAVDVVDFGRGDGITELASWIRTQLFGANS